MLTSALLQQFAKWAVQAPTTPPNINLGAPLLTMTGVKDKTASFVQFSIRAVVDAGGVNCLVLSLDKTSPLAYSPAPPKTPPKALQLVFPPLCAIAVPPANAASNSNSP